MPELPDLQVFVKNLNKIYAGRQLQEIKVVNAKNIQDDASTLNARLKGAHLIEVYRTGKELRFRFSNEVLLGMHLMLRGKLISFDADNDNRHTIVELHFDGKGLALTDYQVAANIKLDPEEKRGTDALSPKLNDPYLKKALQSNQKIKARITNQDVIRGIGNAYADEILWEAKIHPHSVASKIPEPKIKALRKAIRKVLLKAEQSILKHHPDIIAGEVRDFLKIHNSKKEKSPTGATIMVDKKGGSTYYTGEQELFV